MCGLYYFHFFIHINIIYIRTQAPFTLNPIAFTKSSIKSSIYILPVYLYKGKIYTYNVTERYYVPDPGQLRARLSIFRTMVWFIPFIIYTSGFFSYIVYPFRLYLYMETTTNFLPNSHSYMVLSMDDI